MLKDYLKKENITIYELSKKTGIAYSTLSDLCNGKVDIDNCKVSIIKKLSEYFNISMNNIYNICLKKDNEFIVDSLKKNVCTYSKNKNYYVKFKYKNKDVDIRLCKVNKNNTDYLKEIASWIVDDYVSEKRLEEIYDLQFNEKR